MNKVSSNDLGSLHFTIASSHMTNGGEAGRLESSFGVGGPAGCRNRRAGLKKRGVEMAGLIFCTQNGYNRNHDGYK